MRFKMRVVPTGAVLTLATVTTFAQPPEQAAPCADSLARGVVCEAANRYARESMQQSGLTAIIAVQDVRTGALVASAASRPDVLDVTTQVLPLSFMKVFLAASWWDHHLPDETFDCVEKNGKEPRTLHISVHELLVTGCDLPGKQMALALRRAVGGLAMISDLKRFAMGENSRSSTTLRADMNDHEWADTWSIGEANVTVTALDISRFLQAVGNRGVVLRPSARLEPSSAAVNPEPRRMMREQTAALLRSSLLDVVRRGTAKGSDADLEGTNWRIGGKTGSGPLRPGQELDGWFAGLIFDSRGDARFTVATFVRQGGYGGGNAARLSARVARYLAADTDGVR
jgi:cell division protein FtsI/penicillin-binding protein 2